MVFQGAWVPWKIVIPITRDNQKIHLRMELWALGGGKTDLKRGQFSFPAPCSKLGLRGQWAGSGQLPRQRGMGEDGLKIPTHPPSHTPTACFQDKADVLRAEQSHLQSSPLLFEELCCLRAGREGESVYSCHLWTTTRSNANDSISHQGSSTISCVYARFCDGKKMPEKNLFPSAF